MNKASVPDALHPDCELLSGLMDGELTADEANRLLGSLCTDAQLRAHWVAFHVVGDALRSNEVAAAHSAAFCLRVSEAISREPTVLAPRATTVGGLKLRRYLAPGLAVAASAAVIGFVAVPLMKVSAPPAVPAVQQAVVQPSTTAVAADEGARRAATTVANARAMQAYLAAHRELTTGAALPRATPYLRTTTEQPEGR
jgi:sigma-E factor negative regulatory protein RseA